MFKSLKNFFSLSVFRRQLNATLELEQQQKVLYQRKCYANEKINNQGQRLNENHLIEKQIHHLAPGHLIIFGKLDKTNSPTRNRLIIKTNGIVRWHPHVENFVWNNLGKFLAFPSLLRDVCILSIH